MMPQHSNLSRRRFLKTAAVASVAAPTLIPGSSLGADGAVAPSERIVFAGIGMGGQGRGDLGGFLGFPQIQCVAVCDVVGQHRDQAKRMVDDRYHGLGIATLMLEHLAAILARHGEVEGDEVGFEALGLGDALVAVLGLAILTLTDGWANPVATTTKAVAGIEGALDELRALAGRQEMEN